MPGGRHPGQHHPQRERDPAAMTSGRRLRHIAAARIGRTKNTTIRVMLPPRGLATRNNGTAAAAAIAADSRSTALGRGSTITRPTHDAITPRKPAPWNGNTPGSGNSAEAAAIGVTVRTAIAIGDLDRHVFAVAPAQPCVDHDATEPDCQECTGDRAGERRQRSGQQRDDDPSPFVRRQRDEAEGQPEREREPPDRQVDRGTDGEPAGGDRPDRAEMSLEQDGEGGGGDRRCWRYRPPSGRTRTRGAGR